METLYLVMIDFTCTPAPPLHPVILEAFPLPPPPHTSPSLVSIGCHGLGRCSRCGHSSPCAPSPLSAPSPSAPSPCSPPPPAPSFLAHPIFTPHALCWQVEAEAWGAQLGAGISSVGLDSTLYDHVLDTICWVGAIPQRFQVSHCSVGESSEAVGAIICWVGAIPQCGTPACNQPCSPADFSSLLVDMPLPVPLVRPVPDSPPPP